MTALRRKRWGHYLASGDLAMLSPSAAKLRRLIFLNSFMDVLMLVLGTVLAVPVSRAIAQSWHCTLTTGKDGVQAYYLQIATEADATVNCYDFDHLLWAVSSSVLLLFFAPVMFGLIAANGKARFLFSDFQGRIHRWGFLEWECWKAASARTTDLMPMGILTRNSNRLYYELCMGVSRISLGISSIILAGEGSKVTEASVFSAIACCQLLAVLTLRPYCHSKQFGFVVGLYTAVVLGNLLGLLVMVLDDPSLEFPVNLLFGSWVLSAVVVVLVARFSHHTGEHKLKIHRPATAWTPVCNARNKQEEEEYVTETSDEESVSLVLSARNDSWQSFDRENSSRHR